MSEEKLNEEQAKSVLEAVEKDKQEKFLNEYNSICEKYGYSLSPVVQVSSEGTQASFNIVKKQG